MTHSVIPRAIAKDFRDKIKPGKVLILLGARRVGKTEFLLGYLDEVSQSQYLYLNGDDQQTIDLMANRTAANYRRLLGQKKLLVIDEAQMIPDIGLKLKLIVDTMKDVSVVATGSTMFDLSNKLGEPLVGRSNTMYLYPLAQQELSQQEDYKTTLSLLEERLIFGGYPELEQYALWDDKITYLEDIINNYLLKDILAYDGIRKADKIYDLLRLIAYQVGQEVNMDELASSLKGISRNTVEHYLDLLSKVFIVYRVGGFSRNLRKEVTKSHRFYFYDNGIRNAIIRNFNNIDTRHDVGALWENYLFSERIKYNTYNNRRVNIYFWRTYDQQEIDLIEEAADSLSAFEFKWKANKKVKVPGGWTKAYPSANFEIIHPDNYLDFIT